MTLTNDIIPGIEREIAKGTFVPLAEKVAVIKTVKEYGELYFKRHVNDRRSHVQQSYKNLFKKHIVGINRLEIEELELYKASSVIKYRSRG